MPRTAWRASAACSNWASSSWARPVRARPRTSPAAVAVPGPVQSLRLAAASISQGRVRGWQGAAGNRAEMRSPRRPRATARPPRPCPVLSSRVLGAERFGRSHAPRSGRFLRVFAADRDRRAGVDSSESEGGLVAFAPSRCAPPRAARRIAPVFLPSLPTTVPRGNARERERGRGGGVGWWRAWDTWDDVTDSPSP
jgi:hypothetical protein